MKPHIRITSQTVAQGSYGLTKINPRNGQRIGDVITVWHVAVNGTRIGTYLTRAAARDAAASEMTQHR